jgi:hypothetical protein
LVDIDTARLREYLLQRLKEMRTFVTKSGVSMDRPEVVSNVLQTYLNEMRAKHTIVTNKIWAQVGPPPKGSVIMTSEPGKLEAVYVQIGTENHMVRISWDHFRDHLYKKGINGNTVMHALERSFSAKKHQKTMASGTIYSYHGVMVDIDMQHPEMQKVMDITTIPP